MQQLPAVGGSDLSHVIGGRDIRLSIKRMFHWVRWGRSR